MRPLNLIFTVAILLVGVVGSSFAEENAAPRRLLLLYSGPDGHPAETHEFEKGTKILAQLLSRVSAIEAEAHDASGEWHAGPELLAKADGAVLFLTEGPKWLAADPRRLEAFAQLAQRKGGLSAFHAAVWTRPVEPIAPFVRLLGGCHGGPDRKYKVLETGLTPAEPAHPTARGIEPFRAHDEYYYQLKLYQPAEGEQGPQPVLLAEIEGEKHPVAWAWERPDGGRSFGFTGLHFHRNWERPEYRRLVVQGILWSLRLPIPDEGADISLKE